MNEIMIERHHLPQVLTVGKFNVEEPWVHGVRHLNINTMLVIVEGKLLICEDGMDYEVPENHVFFFKAGCKQWGKRTIKPPAKWYWSSFLPIAMPLEGQMIQLPKVVALDCPHVLFSHMETMEQIYLKHDAFYKEQLNGMLYELFFRWLLSSQRTQEESSSESISDKVMQILKGEINNRFSTELIANQLGMNYSYIGRKFKSETGKTILEAYQELKIRKAIEMLTFETLNISEVSDILGYPNPYYFSRVFKNVTGLSPRDYIKQMYQPRANQDHKR